MAGVNSGVVWYLKILVFSSSGFMGSMLSTSLFAYVSALFGFLEKSWRLGEHWYLPGGTMLGVY
jgi:hypothetical protein